MNKDTIIGFVLIALVLIGFSWYNQPSAEEVEAARKQDSIAAAIKDHADKQQKAEEAARKAKAEAAAKGDSTALFFSALNGTNETIVLKNGKVELSFNTKGGTITKAIIKDFENVDNSKNEVMLFNEKTQQMNFMLAAKSENIITKDLFFTPSNVTDSTVTMTAQAGNGGSIVFNYWLGPDYLLHFTMQANGLNGMFAPSYKEMDIEWTDLAIQQTSEKIDEKIEKPLDWVAFKNQFFSAALISKDDFSANALLTSIPQQKGSGYLKQFNAKLKTAFDPTGVRPSEFEMYIGPNDFRLIKDVEEQSTFGKDLDLEQLVYLGWWLVRWINRWFTIYVFDWLTSWGFGMGIVLILITLLLKVLTFPMVKKSYMSSAKMRVLKPKLDEATKQYDKPEDAMKKQQEMMNLYSKYGVSPLGGCLPMLIQFPIWMAMFFFVPNAIQLRRESFLWIDDLSTYDPIIEWGTNIWGIGDHLSLTCILFCVANVLYSYMTMRQQKDQMVGQQAEQMKMMQWNFYYFISLFFSAAIMWTLRKTTNDAKLLAILEAKYQENKNNPTKKTSGLAARLEALQKQAEEQKRQRMNQQKR